MNLSFAMSLWLSTGLPLFNHLVRCSCQSSPLFEATIPAWLRSRDWKLEQDPTFLTQAPPASLCQEDNNRTCAAPPTDPDRRHLRSIAYPLFSTNLHLGGEDIFVFEHFFYGMTGGLFLEAGAADGFRESSTMLLERYAGWRGIHIEGSPINYRLLINNRPDTLNLNAVLCSERAGEDNDGVVTFKAQELIGGIVRFMEPGKVQGLDVRNVTVDGNGTVRVDPNVTDLPAAGIANLPCLSLRRVLRRFGIRHINFMMVDIEGAEWPVLEAFNFSDVTVDVLAIETNAREAGTGKADLFQAHLSQYGYRMTYPIHGYLGLNTYFLREGFVPSTRPGAGRQADNRYREVLLKGAPECWRNAVLVDHDDGDRIVMMVTPERCCSYAGWVSVCFAEAFTYRKCCLQPMGLDMQGDGLVTFV
ncbi:unnamed protein product [Vitrella brassicaformis CCMP3155]|uniref:Methyltransferase FkbM domain-containing protein n=2 Tax=Vitrella brassicaformis TaxID=1169539 RepID=A0A0G4GWH7_VITBC|nr:unnamed protein product [Vitrella brassicaformis CCMP3155]|eukprot:CEM35359.1 unnamed protein product [Vitrella brassicaformis CCMP3155]